MNNVTQLDIARKLNVSRITVSKALRNHPDISKDTKEKVQKVVAELGYVPNLIAKNLITNKTNTIGIVIPDLENTFFAYIIDVMIDVASEHGYSVFVTVSRENKKNEITNILNLIGMRVDGLLACITKQTNELQIFEQVTKMGIPLVFFDRHLEKSKESTVTFDDLNGGILAVEKIIKEGYTKIAHFAGPQKINIGKQRCQAYKDALNKYKIKIKNDWILEGGFDIDDGITSFMKLYNENNLPEVILAVNDRVAWGIYTAATEVGINIPEELGIVAYGFSETAKLFSPNLSVINQNPRVMGRMAMNTLLQEIKEGKTSKKQHLKINENFIWNLSLKQLKK